MATLKAIRYKDGNLEILDQLKLPHQTFYIKILTLQDGWTAINQMNVTKNFFVYNLCFASYQRNFLLK